MSGTGLNELYRRLEEIRAITDRLKELSREEDALLERLLALGSGEAEQRRRSRREDFLRIARTWRDGLHIAPEEAIALTREQLWDLPADDLAWVIRELA